MAYLQNKLDTGRRVAAELAEVRRFFIKADETYRKFRKFLMEEPVDGDLENNPVEWLPISDD